jgi:hypothetical protein
MLLTSLRRFFALGMFGLGGVLLGLFLASANPASLTTAPTSACVAGPTGSGTSTGIVPVGSSTTGSGPAVAASTTQGFGRRLPGNGKHGNRVFGDRNGYGVGQRPHWERPSTVRPAPAHW